jgi:phosphoenolpyruvate---glycerone phosphotransferase subunit DhaL
MALDADTLVAALGRWTARLERAAPELNALDGQLGDGDLGATLEKCAANVRKALATPPADIGGIFRACAVACTKASGSSLGTLLAVAFLTAGRLTAGQREIPWSELSGLLGKVIVAMAARGGAKLGDKTVLDTIEAARVAIAGIDNPARQHAVALAAVDACLAQYRGEINQIGRARMFGERSRGLDDPGMVAFRHMVASLAASDAA